MTESARRLNAMVHSANYPNDSKSTIDKINHIISNPNSMKDAISRIEARYNVKIGEMRYKV